MEESGEEEMGEELRGSFWHWLQHDSLSPTVHMHWRMGTKYNRFTVTALDIKLWHKALPSTGEQRLEPYQIPHQRGPLHWTNLWNNSHSLTCYCWTWSLRHRLWLRTGPGAHRRRSSSPTSSPRAGHNGRSLPHCSGAWKQREYRVNNQGEEHRGHKVQWSAPVGSFPLGTIIQQLSPTWDSASLQNDGCNHSHWQVKVKAKSGRENKESSCSILWPVGQRKLGSVLEQQVRHERGIQHGWGITKNILTWTRLSSPGRWH